MSATPEVGSQVTRRAAWLTAVLLLAAAGCTGCSGSSKRPAGGTRPGYTEYQGNGFDFAYPAGWHVLSGTERFVATAAIEVAGPTGGSELPPLISAFVDTIGGTLDQRVSQLNDAANIELPGRVVTRTADRTVPGGKGRLVESEYSQALRAGGTAKVTQWDLVVMSSRGRTVDLRMGAPTAGLNSVKVNFDTAMATLRLGTAA